MEKITRLKNLIAIPVLFILTASVLAQEVNYWKHMADVEIKIKPDPSGKYEVEYPIFGEKARTINGEMISLKGYMVPLKEFTGHRYFVLSAYPFNMCFFCGAAGPETVIEVYSKEEIEFTDDKIIISGRLKLNTDNPDHLMYLLEDAFLID